MTMPFCSSGSAEAGRHHTGTADVFAAPPEARFRIVARGEPASAGDGLPSSSERGKLVAGLAAHGARLYVCNRAAHGIDVLDAGYRPLFSFGGAGDAIGQFETPSDLAIVWAGRRPDQPMLAVADRGNHRVQLFELDGAPLGVVGASRDVVPSTGWPLRAGWPFFRMAQVPPLPFPSRLEWRAPFLDVMCAAGTIRVDIGAALLPSFEAWLAAASLADLARALRHFSMSRHASDIPHDLRRRIDARLQAAAAYPAPSVEAEWA